MLNLIGGATIAEKAINSGNPWIYLAIFLIMSAALAGRYIFNYLIKLDQSHREESKERERKADEQLQRTNVQLDKAIEANRAFSETQKDIVAAINSMGTNVNDVKKDVKELRSRIDEIEKSA